MNRPIPSLSIAAAILPSNPFGRAPQVGDMVAVDASGKVVMWSPSKGPGSRKCRSLVEVNAKLANLKLAILTK